VAVSYDAPGWDAKENREGASSRITPACGSASCLIDHLNPKLESQIFALRISKVRAKFLLITLRENSQVERDELSKVLYVVAIALNVAFQSVSARS